MDNRVPPPDLAAQIAAARSTNGPRQSSRDWSNAPRRWCHPNRGCLPDGTKAKAKVNEQFNRPNTHKENNP